MSIITVFDYFNKPKKVLPLYNMLNHIKTGKYRYLIERLRHCREHDDTGDELDSLNRIIPRFSVSGNFMMKRGVLKIVSYSGNFLLEIPYMNEKDIKDVKLLLMEDPFVLACFENASKTGLVILVNGTSTQVKHHANFSLAVKYYRQLTGARVSTLEGMRANSTCMVSMDKEIYIAIGGKSFTEFIR